MMKDTDKSQNQPIDFISVCICTYKRPEMLASALEGVSGQVTEKKYFFEVIVVDNDVDRSAEKVVKQFQGKNGINIIYDCELEQNIALARNRAIQNARGNLIAFIDDDECPVKNWLCMLYHTMKEYHADGVLGPVIPSFPPEAPQWLKKGNIFNRRRFLTGSRLTVRDTRTGNVLLSRGILPEGFIWFDPKFGRTGGEDVDFFAKQIAQNRTFVWCDEAEVYEKVPPDRWTSSFNLKKYVRIGTLNGERLCRSGLKGYAGLVKSIAAVPVWSIVMLFSLPLGKHKWMPPALKLTYSLSSLLSFFGISLIRYRD